MVRKADDAGRFAPPRKRASVRSMEETMQPETAKGEPTRQLTARVPESLHREIRQHVAVRDISVQDFVRNAVSEALARARQG